MSQERLNEAIVSLGLEGRLRQAYAGRFDDRCPPMVSALTDGVAQRAMVVIDLTLFAKEGDEKAYRCTQWEGAPWIQHRSVSFTVSTEEERSAADELKAVIEERFNEALGNLAAVHLWETAV